jgi:putative peptidoglycan lipid II flippase
LIYFLLPQIVPLYTSGYNQDLQENIIMLGRIILLQPIFLGVSSLISSLAQTENKFLAFSLAPIIYNLGIIFGIIFFYDIYGIAGLGYGVILGAVLHLLTQSFSLIKE